MAVEYTWSEQSGRFRDSAGRFVSDQRVRGAVDAISDAASERMAATSARLVASEISLAAWQSEMAREIKLAHTSVATLAHGGQAAMTPARWLAAGRSIKSEYAYLRDFAEQIADGRQPISAGLVARSRQYGQGARVQYERVRGRGQKERGYQSERNLTSAGESCAQCLAQSARGLVPIGSLVPVGRRTCRAACKCSIRYEMTAAEAA